MVKKAHVSMDPMSSELVARLANCADLGGDSDELTRSEEVMRRAIERHLSRCWESQSLPERLGDFLRGALMSVDDFVATALARHAAEIDREMAEAEKAAA